MKKLMTFLTVLAVLTIYSCSQTKQEYGVFADSTTEDLSLQIGEPTTDKVETMERKIIKQGRIKFKTADVGLTKSLITQTVQELKGYVSNENAYDYSDRFEHRLTIRVPADKFDLLLSTISENVEKLDSKNIEVLDVTEEYIDIEARIKTKKELQNKYIELLKRATKVEEILNIEKEIGDLQTDIESVEGRMKYLKDNIAFSTLTVTYYQNISSSFGFTSKFVEGVKEGWSVFLLFIVGLSYIWVFIFIAAVTIYIIRLLKKKKKQNRKNL
jgi:hypothetical protein